MSARAFRQLLCSILAAGSLLGGAAQSACQAADASPWTRQAHSAVRLITASSVREQGAVRLRAGVELELAPGWKTYWRYPGDSGVPPRFNFDGSENVKEVVVLWPAPQRFSDGGGDAIGYIGRVVFPLRVTALEERKAVLLRLDLDYGVCEKLCVPVDAKLQLPLAEGTTAHESVLAASEARVPTRVAIGPRTPLAVLALRREHEHQPERVIVDVASQGSDVDLFVEGPTAEWALPLPQRLRGGPADIQRFVFALDGLPPGASTKSARLKLTAVSASAAVEVLADLD